MASLKSSAKINAGLLSNVKFSKSLVLGKRYFVGGGRNYVMFDNNPSMCNYLSKLHVASFHVARYRRWGVMIFSTTGTS
jgi:hypothetical protein